MSSQFCLWGYVSPDAIIPLASALSAIVGGLLLLGHRLQMALALLWRPRSPRRVPIDKDDAAA